MDIIDEVPDEVFDLIIIDPPYNLGKDIANDDLSPEKFKAKLGKWIEAIIPKLKPNGSLYCFMGMEFVWDLKRELDKYLTFKKCLIWKYTGTFYGFKRNFPDRFDFILFYVKSEEYTFNLIREEPTGSLLEKNKGKFDKEGNIPYENLSPYHQQRFKKENYEKNPVNVFRGAYQGNLFDIPNVSRGNNPEQEYGKHPTQKPEALLEKLIAISSKKGELVADFFLGSGTTLVVAKKLRRKWFGTEKRKTYYKIAKKRIKNTPVYQDIKAYLSNNRLREEYLRKKEKQQDLFHFLNQD